VKELKLFSHVKIADDAYVITENYDQGHRYTIGLIIGSEKAMAIDAGLGMAGDLAAYIREIVGNKPVFAVFTHGHSDVLGGSAAFDEVYLNKADQGTYGESTDMQERINQMGFFSAQNPEIKEYGLANARDNGDQIFKDLKHGDHFDLGCASADIIEIPGHTPGSVIVRCTLKNGRHVSFCGDAFSTGMNHFMNMDSAQLKDYGNRLKAILKSMDANEEMYCTHASMPVSPTIGMTIADACLEVADGDTEGDPVYMNPFARGKQQNLKTHYSGNNFIVYNADLL